MTASLPGGPVEEQFPGGSADAGRLGGGALPAEATWHRLHPLSPFVRAGRQMVSLLILVFGVSVLNDPAGRNLATDLLILTVALAGGFVSWLVTRWQIADSVLRVETGLLRRQSRRMPLSQVQAVDVVQTGLARVLGLAELRVRVAGGDSARDGQLACLRLAEAERLRLHLLALGAAPAVQAAAPAGARPEPGYAAARPGTAGTAAPEGLSGGAGDRLLFRVRAVRLPVAVVLSRRGLTAVAAAAATALAGRLGATGGIVAVFLPLSAGVVVALWRQFNGEYGTAVVASPDGIRLRSGLVQTAAETIRPGRIQGIRLVEPLAWRMFGWCRLEVDVAGPKERREDRPEGQRLRALIPVGSRAEAQAMLADLLGGRPEPSRRPPARARWKAPLSYHYLAWSADGHFVVAAGGRVTRQTTWVPLEKIQSIRWSQGPVQRTLGLATVHLDVAGKRVGATIADRDTDEAAAIMAALPDQARAARTRSA